MRTFHGSPVLAASRAATFLTCALLALVPRAAGGQGALGSDTAWASVQQALGGRGTVQPGGVLKFAFPRTDLRVLVDGVTLKPALALGSWVAFKRMGTSPTRTMVMGDLVLTEDEVAPAMRVLQQQGIDQTALHNHVLHESPRILYMHIMAHGDAARMATSIRTALEGTKTPIPTGSTSTLPLAPASLLGLDTAAIAHVLGIAGKVNGGVYQVSVPRRMRVMEFGAEIPPAMGVATALNFQPTGDGKAAITGDFVLTADEINPVIRALGEHGIQVTALHSHMLTEIPRLFFMHFWATGDATRLATGLRAGLDQTAVRVTER